jgi:hypothetical protein
MIVLVPVVMAAPAARTMLMMIMMVVVFVVSMIVMLMRVGLGMGVSMGVSMTMMVVMSVVMMPMVVVAVMGAALWSERALHRGGDAALTAHQFRHRRIVLHVDRIAGNLDEAMLAAEMPGQPHEAQRVLGPHLQQALGRGLDLDETPVLEPQGIAVVDGRFHVEIEQDFGPALARQPRLTAVAGRVIERDRIDHAVGFHGGLADDGGDAGHGFVSRVRMIASSIDRERRRINPTANS